MSWYDYTFSTIIDSPQDDIVTLLSGGSCLLSVSVCLFSRGSCLSSRAICYCWALALLLISGISRCFIRFFISLKLINVLVFSSYNRKRTDFRLEASVIVVAFCNGGV